MEMEQLIINIGSSSKKYALYGADGLVFSCHFEHEDGGFYVSISYQGGVEHTEITQEHFENAVAYFLETYKRYFGEKIIDTLGIRVVAPGDYFQEHRIITDEYIEMLKSNKKAAPLHIEAVLEEIASLRELFPESRLVAASDSAFHKGMPFVASSYGLPKDIAEKYNIKRFGYHGLSVSSVVETMKQGHKGSLPEKVLVLHLGSGCSITALKNGESVDTSMGFTPLEGLLMSTRSGNIDPTVGFFLLEKGMEQTALEHMFNKESGLLGVSSATADMREIISLKEKGNSDAKHAFDLFVYAIIKYIGAYGAVLGGIDALIFTGTIGERSSIVREAIVDKLLYLSVSLNREANNRAINVKEGVAEISSQDSEIKMYVVPANEAQSILQAITTC